MGTESEGLEESQKRQVVIEVEANHLDNMRREAIVQSTEPEGSKFTIVSDEGPYLDGDDSAPSPLSYFCAGVVF